MHYQRGALSSDDTLSLSWQGVAARGTGRLYAENDVILPGKREDLRAPFGETSEAARDLQ